MQINSDAQRAVHGLLSPGLKALLGSQPRLVELASTPLLCAMICALYRDRNQRLPSDRVGLYRACIEALVDRRDPERRIDLSDYPDISIRHKLLLLQDFAYYLLRNGLAEASQEQLELRVAGKLSSLGIASEPSVRDVCRLLIDRSGILREVVAGRVDFVHKTFQEFLAAQAILDEGDIGLLSKKASDDEWREVITLAAGLAPPRLSNRIISSLIQDGDRSSARRHQLHLLAVVCLGAAAATSEELRVEVGKRIKALVPPTNFREAKELAAAGDLATPFLGRTNKKLKAQHAAACVRALSLIGTDAALDALKSYSDDWRQVVQQELFRGWASFPSGKYAQDILREAEHVVVKAGVDPSSLRCLEQLKTLVVEGVVGFDANVLAQVQQLENLTIDGGRQIARVDLEGLSQLRRLSALRLSRLATQILPSFAELMELAEVSISDLPFLLNIDGLTNAKAIEGISLYDLPNVKSIPSFQALGKLVRLSFRNVGNALLVSRELLPRELERLDISSPSGFGNFDFLRDLETVSELRLVDNGDSDGGDFPVRYLIPHLERLGQNLCELTLDGIVGEVDLTICSRCPRLMVLSLGQVSRVVNIQALNGAQGRLILEFRNLLYGFDFSVLKELARPFDLIVKFGGGVALDLAPLVDCEALVSLRLEYLRVADMNLIERLRERIPVWSNAVFAAHTQLRLDEEF
jgi:hypothetical protein